MTSIPLTKPHAAKKGFKVAVMGAGAVGCYFGGMLARGKRSEIDYLNGLIVQRGAALGIATPANRVLWALVKLMKGKPINQDYAPALCVKAS